MQVVGSRPVGQQHTPGPYRPGRHGTIVADHPIVEGPSGSDDVSHYGGYLVAESVARRNEPLLAAAADLFDAIDQSLEYLDETIGPCTRDCECILHRLHAAHAKAGGRR
jgi:hypothetical protein